MNSKDLGVDLFELTGFERGVQQGRSDPLGTMVGWVTPNLNKGGQADDNKAAKQVSAGPLANVDTKQLRDIFDKIISGKCQDITANEIGFLRNINRKL